MKDFLKSLAFRVLVLVAALLVGMMIYAASTGGVSTIPEKLAGFIVTPLQTAATHISDGFDSFIGLFTDGGRLRDENAQLQDDVNTLREQQVELDELRRQNELYRNYLELKEQNPDYRFADARVIAMDPADNYNNFTINAGSLAGVGEGNPVITPDGMVGVVYEVGSNYAKVRTILDPRAPVSVYISRTRDNGITANTTELSQNGLVRLSRLDRTAGAAAGDIVVTYGNGRYPAGLMVGELTEVYAESDGLSLSATIRPFADIARLSDVFVIVDFAGRDAAGDEGE